MTGDRISHDVIRVYDTCVQCRCGRWFDGDTLTEGRKKHEAHHGLEAARSALAGEPFLRIVE